jgi:hypothetical protein
LGKDSVVSHRVVSIAAGNQHYCAVTDEAMWNMYTWGYNSQGQLGLGEMFEDHEHLRRKYFAHPTRVWSRRLTHRIRKAICGATFTVCILSNDHVYGFGTGSALNGPSGHGSSSSSRTQDGGDVKKKKKKKSWLFGGGGGGSTEKTKRGTEKQAATMSPRALLLNLSNQSLESALDLLRDSEEQEQNQKREIKRLFTEALCSDETNIYKKPLSSSSGSKRNVDLYTRSHEDTAYSLDVKTTDNGRNVTVFLAPSERAVQTKMKVQAKMNRSVLERLVTARKRATNKKSNKKISKVTKWTHPDIAQPVILLPKDQLWIGCAEQVRWECKSR